jgi:hypothetical protein
MMFRMRWLKEIVGAEESKLFTAFYDRSERFVKTSLAFSI